MKRRIRAKETEGDIQRRIVDWLELEYGAVVLQNRSTKSGAILDRIAGNKSAKGSPDLIAALLAGRTAWIEIKKPGQKLTKEQDQYLARLQANGHLAFVACDTLDIDRVLYFFKPLARRRR